MNDKIEKEFEEMKNAYKDMFDNISIEQFKRVKEKVENERKITAEDLFEELGYKYYEDDGIDVFNRANCVPNRLNTDYIQFKEISFHKINKEVSIYTYKKDVSCTEFIEEPSPMKINFLTIKELQAINKKCKELGWYNEQ